MKNWKKIDKELRFYLHLEDFYKENNHYDGFAVLVTDGNKKFQMRIYNYEDKYVYTTSFNFTRSLDDSFKPAYLSFLNCFALPCEKPMADCHKCNYTYCHYRYETTLKYLNLPSIFFHDIDINDIFPLSFKGESSQGHFLPKNNNFNTNFR